MISVSDILKILDQIPIWKTVAALPKRMAELEARVATLEKAIQSRKPAEACPLCGADMKVIKVEPHPIFGEMGGKLHTVACTACPHTDTRTIDPSGH